MVKIMGKPILEWVIDWLKREKIKRIIMGVAYRKETVMDYFKDGRNFDIDIQYSIHSVDGETGEGFRLAIERYVDDETFLAMNGDEITNANLNLMAKFHFKHDPIATILVSPLRCPFGTIEINEKNYVINFNEKPIIPSIMVSAGVYIFNHRIIDYLPLKGKIETITFPKLAEERKLLSYELKGYWFTINTKKDLTLVSNEMKKMIGWF
ncbi:MAG: NDP-sugar synthase, partial [Candidatus Hodarchaeota archaeon]